MKTLSQVQAELQKFNLYAGVVDGTNGTLTTEALKKFQSMHGLTPDGKFGPATERELFPVLSAKPPLTAPPKQAFVWPSERDVVKIFGVHGGAQCTAGLVKPKFAMRYGEDYRPITHFSCHEKVAVSAQAIFDKAFDHYGAEKLKELRLDVFGGCFNDRLKRGSTTERSMHAWGIAIDLDPAKNQLRMHKSQAEFGGAEYNEWWKIVASEGGYSLGVHHDYDWMHFQFARR